MAFISTEKIENMNMDEVSIIGYDFSKVRDFSFSVLTSWKKKVKYNKEAG